MEISKESFLHAEDPKLRDSMLYDMLIDISCKMDKILDLEKRVTNCERRISVIEAVGTFFIGISSTIAGWLGFHR